MEPIDVVRAYHERTKHHYQRTARSAGYMDWATQPEAFRTFAGAPVTPLRRDVAGEPVAFDDLFRRGAVSPSPVTMESLSDLLLHALAVSAWKQAGASRWALRVNPSSGNLHPIEGYLLLPDGIDGPPSIRHYRPEDHALETRAVLPEFPFPGLPEGAFLVGMSTIHWREAWKYGERAFRYGMLDTGHAVAALSFAAALRGWSVRLLDSWPTATVETLLGVDREPDFPVAEEREHGELLAIVSPGPSPEISPPDASTLATVRDAAWNGVAHRLSPDHMPWPVIDDAAAASRHAGSEPVEASDVPGWPALPAGEPSDARRVIRTRRSGVSFDPAGRLSLPGFLRILDRTLPRAAAPFDVWAHVPRIHLALFVHRVDGLEPGLYGLVRDPAAHDRLKASFREDLSWDRPDGVLMLTDTRPCASTMQRRLSGLDRAIYLECDRGRSLKTIINFAAEWQDTHPAPARHVDDASIERTLNQWVDERIMAYLDDRYVSLALHSHDESEG